MKRSLNILFLITAIAACKRSLTPPPPLPSPEKHEWGEQLIDYAQIKAAYPITTDSPNNFVAACGLGEILLMSGNDISMFNKGYYQFSNDTVNERLSYLFYLGKTILADSIVYNKAGVMRLITNSLNKQSFMLDSNSFMNRKTEVKEKPLLIDFHYGTPVDYSDSITVIQALNKLLVNTQGRYYIPYY